MKNTFFTPRNLFVFIALIFAASTRLFPHPDNFTAIGAMGLFAGAIMNNRTLSLVLAMAVMFVTDSIIGFYDGFWVDYIAFALSIVLGWIISKKQNMLSITTASIASAILFYVISNFGVWAGGGMYPMTGAGLGVCYIKALPFFYNGLLSQVLYGGLLFGIFHAVKNWKPSLVKA
ncbi:MAG: hypothetical protein NT084_11920 [Bacteroidetes bacterium]|nr:hypothetical protein [Bacteroidota bacterium]